MSTVLHWLYAMVVATFAVAAPVSESEQMTKLRQQNAELRARLRAVVDARQGTLFISKSDHRAMLKALHPDTEPDPERTRVLAKAFQIFNALPIRVA